MARKARNRAKGRTKTASRKTRTKKSRAKERRADRAGARFVDAFVNAGGPRAVVGLALAGIAGVGLVLGVWRLESRAEAMIATPPDEMAFAWPVVRRISGADGPVQWPPRDVQQRLLELAHARVAQSPDPLSAAALASIGRDLRRTGLLERVESVRRRHGGEIEIRGRWRLPAAAVRHDGRDHLIGPEGELLPVSYAPGQRDFRVILGAAFNPPQREDGTPAFAERWPGEDVRAGLSVLGAVRGRPYWGQVRAVDVSGHSLSGSIEIVTDEGTRVVWGAAPGEFRPGEVDTPTKLANLAALHERYGRIDAGQNRVSVFYEYTDVDRSASAGPDAGGSSGER